MIVQLDNAVVTDNTVRKQKHNGGTTLHTNVMNTTDVTAHS